VGMYPLSSLVSFVEPVFLAEDRRIG
jgi:hypothetical protein